MNKPLILLLYVVLFGIVVSAQSGRRIKAEPTPAPNTEDAADGYSESASQPRRPLIRPQLHGSGGSELPTAATSSDAGQTGTAGEDIVKVETDLITIPVSVFDHDGLYIPNLRQNDFKIFEDGKEQDIAYFGRSDKPFTVVLLIDVSPSTAYRIEEIQRAATAFVDQLQPQDSVMVIDFDSRVHVLTEVTHDRQQIYDAIRKTHFGDGTSLYEAVAFSIRKRLNGIEGRKAVVLFTDGVDTTSRKATYDTTLDDAEESDSLIFPIYFNTFMENNQRNGGSLPNIFGMPQMNNGTSAAEYAVGKKYLEELAAYTGGRVFRPEATPGGLTAAFEGIAEELRRQYNIGFVPKEESKPGQRKQIKVR
ncbi:MAG: VWA domain-containing protein, partial [Pyrinomonadaceae bacterium]